MNKKFPKKALAIAIASALMPATALAIDPDGVVNLGDLSISLGDEAVDLNEIDNGLQNRLCYDGNSNSPSNTPNTSTECGVGVEVTGANSSAFGGNSTVTGDQSTLFGYNSSITDSGDGSGDLNTLVGRNSTIDGNKNQVFGSSDNVTGYWNDVNGSYNSVDGGFNDVTGQFTS
ncbi:MAG: hypothetical protein PVG98_12795, partial [Chromatiales bacterium]